MNHDYTHCLDASEDCPKECFRYQLVDDLKHANERMLISWANLKGTAECMKGEQNGD